MSRLVPLAAAAAAFAAVFAYTRSAEAEVTPQNADVNRDGIVSSGDFVVTPPPFEQDALHDVGVGQRPGHFAGGLDGDLGLVASGDLRGDANLDGVISSVDLAIVVAMYGEVADIGVVGTVTPTMQPSATPTASPTPSATPSPSSTARRCGSRRSRRATGRRGSRRSRTATRPSSSTSAPRTRPSCAPAPTAPRP